MKSSTFEQADVNLKQIEILALSAAEKEIELIAIKNDLLSWLNKWFSLEPHQQLQIQNMDPLTKQQLAIAIANTYAAGLAVNFIKEDKDSDKVPDKKNIIIHGLEDWQSPVMGISTDILVIPLMVRIQYSYMD